MIFGRSSIDTIDIFAKVSILYRYLFSSILRPTNFSEKCHSHKAVRTWFSCDSRAVCDCDIIIRGLIAVWDFKPHLKFANRICFEHLPLCSEDFSIFCKCQTALLPCCVGTNQRLQLQVRHSNHLPTATSTVLESPVWTTL